MLITVVVAGLAVLVGIAVIIGWADALARNGAWTRIAAARHAVWLDEQQLGAGIGRPRCFDCPLNQTNR
ncbi:hypothetical protein ACQPZQ_42925 [Pseudonocardia sp. CA-142604]|uniref:hypothetical protein n=1 Tax=Pseudonocardia sp. CA-142604 TaxID=3240024 RepID=UPI003D8EBF27